jgi:hypothetical protein
MLPDFALNPFPFIEAVPLVLLAFAVFAALVRTGAKGLK